MAGAAATARHAEAVSSARTLAGVSVLHRADGGPGGGGAALSGDGSTTATRSDDVSGSALRGRKEGAVAARQRSA